MIAIKMMPNITVDSLIWTLEWRVFLREKTICRFVNYVAFRSWFNLLADILGARRRVRMVSIFHGYKMEIRFLRIENEMVA